MFFRLHFAAAVGLSTCPGAPRLEFLLGRPLPLIPAADFSVPEVTGNPCTFLFLNMNLLTILFLDSAESILSRFADAGLSAKELVVLMSAHSIAVANVDNTPGIAYVVSLFSTQVALLDRSFLVRHWIRPQKFMIPSSTSKSYFQEFII